jgi:hypothetical protein
MLRFKSRNNFRSRGVYSALWALWCLDASAIPFTSSLVRTDTEYGVSPTHVESQLLPFAPGFSTCEDGVFRHHERFM